jgi:hypothetical protein
MYNLGMKHFRPFATALLMAWTFELTSHGADRSDQTPNSGGVAGWSTNGAAVYQLRVTQTRQAAYSPPVAYAPTPTNLPAEIRRAMAAFSTAGIVTTIAQTQTVFHHFLPLLPNSLNNLVWTNFIAHTNGRSAVVWSVRTHPPDWPARPPLLEWNTSSLMWGMKGLTAISPCWEQEGSSGQVPITALTRRHGYTRGHGMGGDRVGTSYNGKKVWFLTSRNTVVETTVKREIVRTAGRDYTIVLFSSDLPETIQPMRVVEPTMVSANPHAKYFVMPGFPCPIFKTEQFGNVSADMPGFTLDTYKGGDSGSPNMLPMPGELIFCGGRSTSGASAEMQADMDTLCRLEGLDAKKYQLQWMDLARYPSY